MEMIHVSHQPPVLLVNMSSAGPTVRETVQFTPKFHTTTTRPAAKKGICLWPCLRAHRSQVTFSQFGFVAFASISQSLSPNDASVNLSGAQEEEPIAISKALEQRQKRLNAVPEKKTS